MAVLNSVIINIEVSNLNQGIKFYVEAFDLRVGRVLENDVVELLGFPFPFFLLEKKYGSFRKSKEEYPRNLAKAWSPVHLDLVVDSIEIAFERVKFAGGRFNGGIHEPPWGKIASFSDPFGNEFSLIQFENNHNCTEILHTEILPHDSAHNPESSFAWADADR